METAAVSQWYAEDMRTPRLAGPALTRTFSRSTTQDTEAAAPEHCMDPPKAKTIGRAAQSEWEDAARYKKEKNMQECKRVYGS